MKACPDFNIFGFVTALADDSNDDNSRLIAHEVIKCFLMAIGAMKFNMLCKMPSYKFHA